MAFYSSASNFVNGGLNGVTQVFVHDRQTGLATMVSVALDGTPGNGHSGNPILFLNPPISGDGRYVAFESSASNLVADDTNDAQDVFVHDRLTGVTTRVSVASDGTAANDTPFFPSMSADGRYIAFVSWASNLVNEDTNGIPDVFVHDRQTGITTRASVASDGTAANSFSNFPAISADGRFVAFESFEATWLVATRADKHTYSSAIGRPVPLNWSRLP